jgi:hypothetical protein
MTTRLDAIAFKKTQNGKTYAVRLGSAAPKKDGEGYTVYLDAIPAPTDGQWVITLAVPRERGESPAPQSSRKPAAPIDDSSDMPF